MSAPIASGSTSRPTATLPHTRALGERFLAGLPAGVRVIGLPTMDGRTPTFLFTVEGWSAGAVADELVSRGFCVTAHDTFYCLGLHERLGYGEAVRIGIFHYHTTAEVDALLAALDDLSPASAAVRRDGCG